MARVIPARALTVQEAGVVYRRDKPREIEDEGLYHFLIHQGKLTDPDKIWDSIPPVTALPKLRNGELVTVCREMGLGDVLMVLVVIRAMKERYPHLEFRLATGRNYVELLTGLPFLESVQPLIDMNGHHRNVVELRGLSERHPQRMKMDRIDIFALYCGVSVRDYSIPIPDVTAAERARARERIGSGCTISLAVRGSTPLRSWPIENVKEFALLAAREGWTVALLDGQVLEDMPEHARIKNLTGKLSVLEVKGVLAESDFCVSPDTGIQHLAEAVGTKTVALYSVVPPNLRIGHYSHVKAFFRDDLRCAPCWHRGCAPITCTRSITAETVLRALENWDLLETYNNPLKPFALVPLTAQ